MFQKSLAAKCGGHYKKRRWGKKQSMHGFITHIRKSSRAGGQMAVHGGAGQIPVSAM